MDTCEAPSLSSGFRKSGLDLSNWIARPDLVNGRNKLVRLWK
jgi:hypothetical protein